MKPTALAMVPEAGRRSLQTNSEKEPTDEAAVHVNAFEEELGGRDAVVDVLAFDGAPHIQDVVTMLLDPSFKRWSLSYIAKHANVNMGDLLQALRTGALVRAQIVATQQVAAALAAVAADVVRRSQPYFDPCGTCQGYTTLPDGKPCTDCRGTGKVLKQPTLDYQKTALELGELLKSKGAPSILNQNLVNLPGPRLPLPLEQMQQHVTDLLYGPTPRALPEETPNG